MRSPFGRRQQRLSREDIDRIEAKLAAAERMTSAEIRVVFTESSWLGMKARARSLFTKHGLDRTAGQNAVLLLIDTRSREVLVYGDKGVDSQVGPEFWNDVTDAIIQECREGRLAAGVMTGLRLIGEKLSPIFPPGAMDVDDLPNAVVFD